MSKQIYIDSNGNEVLVSGTITNDNNLPHYTGTPTPNSTAEAIGAKLDTVSDTIVLPQFCVAGYTTASGNYADFTIPLATNKTSATITSIGTSSTVFIGSTRTDNPFKLTGSSVVNVGNGFITFDLAFTSTKTANSVCGITITGLTITLS